MDGTTYLVEVYARTGKLKSGQIRKVAHDAMRLWVAKQVPGFETAHRIIAFVSEEAWQSIRGWLLAAIQEMGIELTVIDLPSEALDTLRTAEKGYAVGMAPKDTLGE